MKSSIFFGQPSYFYMWSRRVQQEGCLAAKLCGIKLNGNKNRTVCVCGGGVVADKHRWTELKRLTLFQTRAYTRAHTHSICAERTVEIRIMSNQIRILGPAGMSAGTHCRADSSKINSQRWLTV